MTSFVFRRQLTIAWGDCDPAGIVFNPRFFEMFDASSWMLFEAALGVKAQDLASAYGIVGIALVDARANFLKPAKFGDTIEIASRVSEFRKSSFDIEHKSHGRGRTRRGRPRNAGVGGARHGRSAWHRDGAGAKRGDREVFLTRHSGALAQTREPE